MISSENLHISFLMNDKMGYDSIHQFSQNILLDYKKTVYHIIKHSIFMIYLQIVKKCHCNISAIGCLVDLLVSLSI